MVHRRISVDEESVFEEEEQAECSTFEVIEVLVLLAIHVFDFGTDFYVAFGYFRCGYPLRSLEILLIVYVASFFTSIFERKSKAATKEESHHGFLFYFCGFLMFLFNLSGIVMFLQVLFTLCKCTSASNRELRVMLQNLVYLKFIEGFVESLPQMYLYFVLFGSKEMKSCPTLQPLSFVASYIGFVYTIIHYSYHVTPNITGVFNKIFRALWLFFMSVSWATIAICLMIFFITNTYSTPIILYIHILFTGCVCVSFNLHSKPVVMIILSFLCLSQYFFPDEYRDSDAEKDRFLTIAHILHFIEMGIIFGIWYFAFDHITPFYHAIYFIIGCYILGEFFFIIFQIRLKNSKTLEVRHIDYFRRSRQERVSLVSLRPISNTLGETVV